MRDFIYEVESPWVNFDCVFKQFMDELLLFEIFMASEDIMAASVNILRGRIIYESF